MLFVVLCALLCWNAEPLHAAGTGKMEPVYEWKDIKYKFPTVFHEMVAKLFKSYTPGNPFPLDVDYSGLDPKGRVFIAVPRFLPGVPATLATVEGDCLKPYPNWMTNSKLNPDGITSVLRIKIDECGRLWAVDTGTDAAITADAKQTSQPKVLVYDVSTDELVWSYIFPQSQVTPTSTLGNIAIDLIDGNCDDTFAYIADINGNGLIVVDMKKHKSWRVNGNYFYPYPDQGHFTISGVSFDLMDGVVSVVVNYPKNDTLYFHAFASNVETTLSTEFLRNESNFAHEHSIFKEFNVLPVKKPGQSGPAAVTSKGVMFYSILPQNSLRCWNMAKPFTEENTAEVYQNDETFQWPSGLKVVRDKNGTENVLALTSRYQMVQAGKLNRNEVNFRVLKAPVDSLIEGTVCVP